MDAAGGRGGPVKGSRQGRGSWLPASLWSASGPPSAHAHVRTARCAPRAPDGCASEGFPSVVGHGSCVRMCASRVLQGQGVPEWLACVQSTSQRWAFAAISLGPHTGAPVLPPASDVSLAALRPEAATMFVGETLSDRES